MGGERVTGQRATDTGRGAAARTPILRGRLSAAARAKAGRRAMAVAARHPRLWRFVRAALRRRFEAAAERWSAISGRMGSPHFAAVGAALARLPGTFAPTAIADVGTGTGLLALGLAARFREAAVTGFDFAPAMVARARAHRDDPHEALDEALRARLRFEVADSSALPLAAGDLDLVVLSNTPIFFAEVARVLRPGGFAVVAFSLGPRTPLYLPLAEVEAGLARAGCPLVARGEAGEGEWLLARRAAVAPRARAGDGGGEADDER